MILSEARSCAADILDKDPDLSSAENAVLLKELRKDKYNVRDYSRIS